jgi:hypothetical protein
MKLRGYRLTASDIDTHIHIDWAAGSGADDRGPVGALLMLLAVHTPRPCHS